MKEKLKKWNMAGNHLVYAIGCIIIVLASFLPYVISNEKSMTLMEGYDGIFFLMMAVLIFIFISYEKKTTVGVLGIVMTYLGAYELIHTATVLNKREKLNNIQFGYFVLLVGTLVMLVASSIFVYQKVVKKVVRKVSEKRAAKKNA